MKEIHLELECVLDEADLNDRGQLMSTAMLRYDEVEMAKKEAVKDYSEEMKALRGRMRETQFKSGVRQGAAARLWCPVGTIRTDGEGYQRIKVREWRKGEATGFGNTKIWPLLNRHVWEQHHGPVPAGHTVVFKDRNRGNCDIENLELISRRDLMLRNSSQRWGKDVFEVIQLRGALNRKIRSIGEKQDSGSTQPSL